MGIARINLAERDIDFYTLGRPVPPSRCSWRDRSLLAPGRQKAYGLLSRIGHYEFWTFDLAGRRCSRTARWSRAGRAWRCAPARTASHFRE